MSSSREKLYLRKVHEVPNQEPHLTSFIHNCVQCERYTVATQKSGRANTMCYLTEWCQMARVGSYSRDVQETRLTQHRCNAHKPNFLRCNLAMYPRLSLNLWSSCLSLLYARITSVYLYAWPAHKPGWLLHEELKLPLWKKCLVTDLGWIQV
jgi:hypothetical protein